MIDSLTTHAQTEITEALYNSAAVLSENSAGVFHAYEPDFKRFGYQSLSANPHHFRLKGAPLDVDTANNLATVVDNRYKELPNAIARYDETTGRVARVGSILESGQNVILGGEHGELVDVPLGLLGISNYLRRQNVAHRSAMIVSKAIDYLGVNLDAFNAPQELIEVYLTGLGIPIEPDNTVTVRNFLRVAADRIYFTVPSTQTFADIRKVQQTGIKQFNSLVLHNVKSDMSRRGIRHSPPMLLDVALPGTVTKNLNLSVYAQGAGLEGNYVTIPPEFSYEPDDMVEVIGHINSGITDITKEALLYVMSLRLHATRPQVSISDEFFYVEDKDDVNKVAASLLALVQGLDPDTKIIYDRKGNLPLIRK